MCQYGCHKDFPGCSSGGYYINSRQIAAFNSVENRQYAKEFTTSNTLQGRFAKHVFPGEMLRTEMWWDGGETIVFQLRVVERGVLAITNAAVVFREGCVARQPPAKM